MVRIGLRHPPMSPGLRGFSGRDLFEPFLNLRRAAPPDGGTQQ
jgi:hypothetical protein